MHHRGAQEYLVHPWCSWSMKVPHSTHARCVATRRLLALNNPSRCDVDTHKHILTHSCTSAHALCHLACMAMTTHRKRSSRRFHRTDVRQTSSSLSSPTPLWARLASHRAPAHSQTAQTSSVESLPRSVTCAACLHDCVWHVAGH
jgi:hypothetical protein